MAAAQLQLAQDERVRRVLAADGAVIIEAPAGFGKSHLAAALWRAAADAELLTSADAVASAAQQAGGARVVVIDVDQADPLAVDAIAARATTATLVVFDRVVSAALRATLQRYDCREFGPELLRTSAAEIVALLAADDVAVEPELADVIAIQLGGWPAAAAALAARVDPGSLHRAVAGGIVHHPAVDATVRSLVGSWPAETRSAIRRFATLDRVTTAALDDVTSNGFTEAAVRVGVPLVARPDGWIELPAVLREHLGRPSTADASTIGPHLARSGGLVPAVQVLVGSGCHLAAGDLLTDVAPEVLDGTDGAEVLGLLDVLDAHIDSPKLKMLRVRAHEHLGDVAGAAAAAERVVAHCAVDTVEYVDAQLELTRVAAMQGETRDLMPWVDAVTTNEQRVRLDEIRAIQLAQASDPGDVAAGAKGLARAAAGWEALGYDARASGALRIMAAVPLSHLGEYGQAIEAAMHARRLSAHRLFDRAVCTSFLALNAGLAGRIDLLDREINAALQLAESVPVPWLRLYTNWAQVHRCACLGDVDGLAAAVVATERTLDGLEGHSTATVFFADAATSFAFVDDPERADAYLDRAMARRDENPLEVDIAAQIVAARAGRRDEAGSRAAALRTDPSVPAMRLWRVDLEQALLADDTDAVSRAVALAASAGCAELARIIVDGPVGRGVAVARPQICVLGEPSVQIGRESVPLPTGKPGELLKLLALHSAPVSTDAVIDQLWPDVDLQTGIRRLKNPVNRLRAVLGVANVIRRKGHIALASAVTVDLRDFDTLATRALANHDAPIGVEAAVRALNLYAPVLPGDRLPLASTVAAAAQGRAASLFDVVMSAPLADRPTSAWLLDALLRVDRHDDARLLAVGELALAEGDGACARRCLAEAERVAHDLDIPRSPQSAALAAALASSR